MSRYFRVKFEEYLEEFEQSENLHRSEIEKLKEKIKELQEEIKSCEIAREKSLYVIRMLWELQEIHENSK
jgi:hypothetical protein